MTHVHTQRARPLASLTFSQLTYTPHRLSYALPMPVTHDAHLQVGAAKLNLLPLASLPFRAHKRATRCSLSPHVLADPTQHDTRSHALVRCSVQILSSGTLAVMETPATSWVVAVTVVVFSEGCCFFFFK